MSEDIHERVAQAIYDCTGPEVGAVYEDYIKVILGILRREYGKMVDAQAKLEDERDGNAVETAYLEAKLVKAREPLERAEQIQQNWFDGMPPTDKLMARGTISKATLEKIREALKEIRSD